MGSVGSAWKIASCYYIGLGWPIGAGLPSGLGFPAGWISQEGRISSSGRVFLVGWVANGVRLFKWVAFGFLSGKAWLFSLVGIVVVRII